MVPMITVRLIDSLHLPSNQGAVVPVKVCGDIATEQLVYFEQGPWLHANSRLKVEDSLLQPDGEGKAFIVMENHTGYTEVLEEGTDVGLVTPASVIKPLQKPESATVSVEVKAIRSEEENMDRREKLLTFINIERSNVPSESERKELAEAIADYHEAFSLTSGERGETDLVQFEIDTGEARPKKLPVRRMPFVVREEVA